MIDALSASAIGIPVRDRDELGRGAEAPGNVLLPARATGLPKPSVANASQIVTLHRSALTERAGRLSGSNLELALAGIDVVPGRG